MNLIIASDITELMGALQRTGRYNVLASYCQKNELEEGIKNLPESPEILLVTEGFDCQNVSIADVLTGIKKELPYLRIIYVQGTEFTTGTKRILAKLVENGIYDIAIGDEIKLNDIDNIIQNPKTYAEASKILDAEDSETYPNVFMISSLKPGTGKTFLATNLAVALAKFGVKKRMKSGKFVDPRVLLVDGDLLNLSVGTMLRTDNYDKNMLTALQRISKYIGNDCSYTMSESDIDYVKNYVRSCLYNYKNLNNLYVMSAHNIPLEELNKIAPVHFYFMMQMLVAAFDIIIVDSNSAFDHQTTAALYELSGNIFLLIDNDYNNIQNNLRYISKLTAMGYDNKIKFIVNKDLSREAEMSCLEDLEYDTNSIDDLIIEHRIPLVNPGTIKTIDFGEELVITSDKAPEARQKILEIADSIWEIDFSKTEEPKEIVEKKESKLFSFLNN